MKLLSLFFCTILIVFSCKKTEAPKPEPLPSPVIAIDTTGSLDINITNVVNGMPLVLGTVSYTNANSDTFKVNLLKYYFTNIKLVTATGYTFTEVESYYLVNQANSASLHLKINNIPRADYSKIQFLIGVDNHRNTSGAQTGALDPINDMFWTWNSGYIMAKLEGTSNQSGAATKGLEFHIGGFSGVNSAIRTVELNFPNNAIVSETHTPTLNLDADIAKWFKGVNTINFANDYTIVSVNSRSKAIADNYANMFVVNSVVN